MFFYRESPNKYIISNYRYIGTYAGPSETLQSLWVKPDGTKIYFMGSAVARLRSIDLAEPWNILSATNPLSSSAILVDTGSIAIVPTSMAFSSDGTKLLVGVGGSGITGSLHKYDLSSAWDVSTINTTASQQTNNSNVTGAYGMWLGNNDTTLIINRLGSVPAYCVSTISSSLDLSTITFDSDSGTGGGFQNNNPNIGFTDNGNKVYNSNSAGSFSSITITSVTIPYRWVGNTTFHSTQSIRNRTLLSIVAANGMRDIWMSNDGNYMYLVTGFVAGGGGLFSNRIHMFMIG